MVESNEYVVLVCGGLLFDNSTRLFSMLDLTHGKRPITLLVHGGEAGTDAIADKWAKRHNVATSVHTPDWATYDKDARRVRNSQLLRVTMADLVIITPDPTHSTTKLVELANRFGVPLRHTMNCDHHVRYLYQIQYPHKGRLRTETRCRLCQSNKSRKRREALHCSALHDSLIGI
jgi:7-cyano-7-deazaguanine synthase in queuosine biosynthesis